MTDALIAGRGRESVTVGDYLEERNEMLKPDWFILIEQWVPKGMGQHGVTLPFLVGALAHKSGQVDLNDQHVRDVLDDITQHPVDGYVTEVSWCHEILAPVLNVKRINAPVRMRTSVAIAHPSGKGESLVFGQNLESRWDSKDPLALRDRLAEDATGPVSRGEYSRKPKQGTIEFEYGSFSPKELEYIRHSIMTSTAAEPPV